MQKEKNKVTNYLLKPAFIALVALGLFACDEQEEVSTNTDDVSAKISAGINSRASDTQWAENDEIGLMMFGNDVGSLENKRFNCHYITQAGDGLFTPKNTDDIILYPGDGSFVDFISYYPYMEELESFVLETDVHDQTDLPRIDLMTSDRFEGASKNNPNVLLHFRHRLTKLVFNFKFEDASTKASVESFLMSGMLTKATYNMLTGEFTYDDQSKMNIEVSVDSDSYDSPRATAIVLPRKTSAGVVINIKLSDEREYELTLQEDLELKTETMYIFNITLHDHETPPTISAAIIEPWQEVENINIKSTPLYLVQEPGKTENFKKDDKITVYDVDNDKQLTTFTFDGNKTWTPSPEVYWENMGDGSSEKLTLRAEFVRTAALDDTQMPEVFIAEQEVERFGLVHFDFDIVPAKIVFQLKSDDGKNDPKVSDAEFSADDLAKATIKLPKYIKAYTLEKGVFTPGTTTGDIQTKKVNTQWVALVVPQEKGGRVAVITVGRHNYVLDVTQAIDFEEGKVCKLTVNVTKTQVPSFSASYTNWEEVEAGENLTALIITGSGQTSNFNTGDKMTLFYNNGEEVEELSEFTYNEKDDIWSGDSTIYWEDLADMSKYNFYAVSTLTEAPTGTNQMSDLMFANAAQNGTDKFTAITLAFTKQTTKVYVKLKSKDGTFSAEELATAQIYLPGYMTGAHFVKNEYTAGTTAKDIQLSKVADEIEWTGLIQAQTINSGNSLIKISVLNSDYYIKLKDAIDYEMAKAYTYVVDIKKTGVNFSASYSGWNDSEKEYQIDTDLDK